ncbi:hypothetical protein PCANC_07467 [Puccinia coronata f. sp. avenae]|uniref:Glycosyl transferase CAP10 domain-containing protein n=1 Tax=Puccinia coronata f. sp. avenae TaxID=200324 RepID=A0A2N5VTD9_9BASI|nr:hypothetical protein PCANC_07467 [Puccinia coronata f. sp. avenae]
MSDIYVLSENSGSRKSSLVESLFGGNEASMFPLSPKVRSQHVIGLNQRKTHARVSSFSRVHAYLSQLSQLQHEDNLPSSRPGTRAPSTHVKVPKYRAFLLAAGALFLAYQCISRVSRGAVKSPNTNPNVSSPPLSTDDPHPLGKIIQDAHKSWTTLQQRQSKTYAQAVLEYQRRYKLNPPEGFEKWFSFAKSHGHVLTDEYDSMMEQLSRFRKMNRGELQARTNWIGKEEGYGLIEIKNGLINAHILNNLSSSTFTNTDHENHEFNIKEGRVYMRSATTAKPAHKELFQTQTWTFSKLIEKISRLDPSLFQDMSLAINEHFEPRVVIPWETQENSGSGASRESRTSPDEDNVWSTFRKACPPSSQARKQGAGFNPQGYPLGKNAGSASAAGSPLGFVSHLAAPIKDIYCNSPERHIEQGLFFSNTSKISGLFPVFSQSTAQGFGDIVIPSYLYIRDPYKTRDYANEPVTKRSRGTSFIAGGQASKTHPSEWKEWDVKWEDKKDQMYWRGLLRDGGDNPAGLQSNFGRHRLVKRFGSAVRSRSERISWNMNPTKRSFFGGEPASKMFTTEGVDKAFLNYKTMDVGYLAEDDCRITDPCHALFKASYRLKMWEPFGAAKFFKWSLDLDGIGFSARFLNLLQVGTAVVKQTIYREYYSDWMVPWVHYIPLSVEGDELYNLWTYFLGKDDGVFMAPQSQLGKDGWKLVNHEQTLKQIGIDASAWSHAHARQIDWEIYSYRLLIEWNRIWNTSSD